MTQQGIGILGTGSCLPKDEVSNDEVATLAGVTPEWIERKTQILSRRFAMPHEATSDLATEAAIRALDDAYLPAARIDYVIVSTSTPDSPQPPTAALVQNNLNARGAACFDVNVVCSGFVFALALARSLIALKPGAHALVIGADIYSRILDFTDRRTAVLFADGAGAVVVGAAGSGHGMIDFGLHTRGEAHDLLGVAAGGSRMPASHDTLDDGSHFFTMQGRKVSEFVMEHVPSAVSDLVERNDIRIGDVKHFIPHQPNGNLLSDLVLSAGLDGAATHRTLEKYGNVGSACIPVTLDEANREGRFIDGDLMLLAGFGGGMAVGTCLLRWGA